MEENFSPVSPEIYEEKQTKEEKPIKTAADRLRETVNMPDFGIPEIQTNDEIFKEAPTPLPLDIAHKLVDGAKIREGIGEQTAVAIENALTGIGAFGDQATLAFGQVTSAVTGNTIAEDFMDTAVKNLEMRMEDMKYAEDSVGGIRNLIAQLAGGTVSMGELLLVSAATGGMGGYVQMGVQAFGEGAFNDMEKYKEEHGGSLKGYQPKNLDIAINAGNAFLQAVIEKKFGVSSPRFLTGLSRGLVAEGASGFLQESTQSALADLAEYAKGNKEVEGWLDDAEGWIRDGIVGAILQGSLGAATYNYAHNNAIKFYAKARAQAQGRETPNNEDTTFGKNIVNAKERGYASALTQEFNSAFDASTGEGQLRDKIAFALKKAVDAKDLDLDVANEEELGPRIMQIATQETLNAMDYAREQNRAISDMELNNIVYKDGAIWLEGLTPEVGDKAVSYARVLAERQSGLAELQTKIDANTREIQQLKADLAEAKAQKQESRAQVLQARIDKQNAIAEKNRLQAQKLEVQTAELEKQIAKQAEQVKVAEPVEMAKIEKKEPVAEPKSLKEERVSAKEYMKKVKEAQERINNAKRIKIETKKGVSILEANKELLDSVDIFTKNDILRSMMSSTKISSEEIDDIFNYALSLKNSENYGEYFSNLYYDISVKPNTSEQTKKAAKQEYEKIFSPSVDDDGLLHQAKPAKEETTQIQQQFDLADENARLDDIYPEYTGETIEVDGKERTVYNSNGDRIAKSKEALTNFWRWFGDSKVADEQGRPLVVYHGALGHANLTEISPEYGFNVKAVYTSDNKNISTHYAQSSYIKRNIPNIKNKIADAKSVEDVVEILKNYGKDVKVIESFTDDKGAYYRLDIGLSSETLGYKTSDTEYETSGGLKINLLEKLKKYATRIATESETSDLYPLYLSLQNPLIVDANKKSFWKIDFEGKTTNTETIVGTAKERNYDGVIVKNVYETDYENVLGNDYIVFKSTQIKSVDNRGTYSSDIGNILKQGSVSGKGDTNRGGYDDQLKRIILGEKSDLSTIQHEFAHYWIQNNFKWARSGLASQDWLRRWRDVEEWLGIEPQDRLLSRSASEKFAKAYERYILEGKVAPELQWAFEGFQKAYQDIYDDLEKEYFDLEEELAPEVIDWFNRNKEQSPKRLLQADEKKLEKSLTLAAGGSVIEEAPENTIVMTEQNKEGDPVVYMGVKQSEIPAGDNLLVQADKTTASKLQQSAKRWLSDKVEVQQLTTLDTQATLKNFKDWIARDRQGAWNAMMNPDTRPIYRTYLYKAFAEQAMNDVNLAMELANVDIAKSVRELGQAIQALDIRNESGFDMIEIIRNLEKSKGKLSEEELNNSIAESGVFDVELSEEEMNEIDSETECKL